MFKIVERDGSLYLEENLFDLDDWAGLFYDHYFVRGKKTLNWRDTLDLIYEAENHGLLRFGVITKQPEETLRIYGKVIQEYYKKFVEQEENE